MVVIPAGEARKPGRDLPMALLIGMATVAIFYVLIQIVSIGTLPELATSQRPLADAAIRFLGPGGAAMITAGIVISLAGNLNVRFTLASQATIPARERKYFIVKMAPTIRFGTSGWRVIADDFTFANVRLATALCDFRARAKAQSETGA